MARPHHCDASLCGLSIVRRRRTAVSLRLLIDPANACRSISDITSFGGYRSLSGLNSQQTAERRGSQAITRDPTTRKSGSDGNIRQGVRSGVASL